MNIFILEDNNYKYEALRRLIIDNYPKAIITRKIARNSALKKILSEDIKYDLFIVDMQTPIYADELFTIYDEAGRFFIYELERKGLNPNAFIFSSEDPDEDEELDWVTYNASSIDWRDEVIKRIGAVNGK